MHQHFSLVPHAVCWKSDPALIWTMVGTNVITFLSYLAICGTLLCLAGRTRRVLVREWAYFVVGFALFIVACGSTHLFEVVTTWIPIFWADAWANMVTAALSGYVAIQFFLRAKQIGYGINDYAGRLANAEQEKNQMEASLLAAQKLEDWSRVSASVSHEISNPLESIQNLLFLIRTSEGVPQNVIEYASTAALEAERTATIARSALDLMRQSATPRPVDLREAAESVQHLLKGILYGCGVSVQITAEVESKETMRDAAYAVEAFPGEARQVLLNLIRNAAEASCGEGAVVCVHLVARPAEVELAVVDQGVGIDPSVLPNLFQFGVSTKGDRGNGMGLWTVEHILKRHSGRIDVASKPGLGTTFTLHWPRVYGRGVLAKPVQAPADSMYAALSPGRR